MKRMISVSDIALIFTTILTLFMGIIYLILRKAMEVPFRYVFLMVILVLGIVIFNGIKLNASRSKGKSK